MSTFQYIHPSCSLKEESDYTHFSRSIDTNVCNPMVNELKSNTVPLNFNYNAEITFPLGVCENNILQIGPIRSDHAEEQLWNNFQFRKHYTHYYDREKTLQNYVKRRDSCGAGGRIGCSRMDNEQHPDFKVQHINRPMAGKKGSVSSPIQFIGDYAFPDKHNGKDVNKREALQSGTVTKSIQPINNTEFNVI